MMESWDDARLLLAVVRAGSFTEAARRLGVNQSTVSRRVSELEQSLGRSLFYRSAHSFVATELAERLAARAAAVEVAMAELTRATADGDEPAGTVRVATAEELISALLVPALAPLLRDHPRLSIELVGGSELVDLTRRDADVALRVVRPRHAGLVQRAVARLRYAPYASRGYLRRCRAHHELAWLVLDDPRGQLPEARWVEQRLAGRAPRLRATSTLDLAAAAAAGLGVALLPEALARRHENLVRLDPDDDHVLERRLWLVTHASLVQVARVRVVMDWIARTCAAAA